MRVVRQRRGAYVFPLCSALFFFGIIPVAFAHDLTVLVEDTEFALPLEGAALTLPDGSVVHCDSTGRAVLTIAGGESVYVQVSYPGYTGVTARVSPGDTFVRVSLASRDEAVLENSELV